MSWQIRIAAFLASGWTAKWALGVCILSLALWAYSGRLCYCYRPLEPLAVACRVPGTLFQVCSQRGALHFLVMPQGWNARPEFAFERLTYLGNAGYHHGAVGALGFVFALLPTRYDGGDYLVAPHVAVVVPYWFLTGLSGAIFLRWLYLRYKGRESGSPAKIVDKAPNNSMASSCQEGAPVARRGCDL